MRQVRRTLDRYEMLGTGDRILVAVSGGPDSVALLGVLAALSTDYGIELCVAHLNHRLRGGESLRDQQCAEMVAARLGIRCVVGTSTGLEGVPNLEAQARTQRYAFLSKVASAQKCTKIATGHTRDDQAETVLMRLLRGTGCDGLAGIHPVRDGFVIRPLIECSRRQVLAFVQAARLPFCLDSSNADRRFVRNRVRHEVMPLLQSISPGAPRRLACTAAIVAEEAKLLDERVEGMVAPTRSPDGSLGISALRHAAAGLRPRVVRRWLQEQRGDLHRLTAAHFRAIIDLARGGCPNGRVRLPAGHLVVREYERLRFRPVASLPTVEPARWLEAGSAVESAAGWRISAEVLAPEDGQFRRPPDLWSLAADAEVIRTPLRVRTARPGDRIRPLGLGGQRKLHDIFVDRKVPLDARRTHPVVECDGAIVWVPGLARAAHGLITPATRRALCLVALKTGIAGA